MPSPRLRKGNKPHSKQEDSGVPEDSAVQPSGTRVKDVLKRSFFRICFIIGALVFATYYQDGGSVMTFAKQSEFIEKRSFPVACSRDYSTNDLTGCVPKKCGRVVIDGLVTPDEASQLLSVAKKGLSLGGSNGGASILDLHSGALSFRDKFINIYKLDQAKGANAVFTSEDFLIYRTVKDKILSAVMKEFGLVSGKLYLTSPTFFSRMTIKEAQMIHDEYWHPHIDKETYNTFDYTSLVYLSDYGKDFTGGRFVFIDKDANRTVEPKMGRLSLFTSGSENVHYVEKLASGTRYALTVAFSCEKKHAIDDPVPKT